MIKVFSFTASCHGEASATGRFSDMVAERLKVHAAALGEEIQYERLSGNDLNIRFCLSCNSCFQKGVCPLDEADDMARLKQKFLDADILLFGSPVYIGSMSGLAKAVLDRLSVWAHRLELAGKTVGILVTASNNNGEETVSLIKKSIQFMGASTAYAGCSYLHAGTPKLGNMKEMGPELDRICSLLLDSFAAPEKYIEPWQDTAFRILNSSYKRSQRVGKLFEIEPQDEQLVWERRSIGDYKSLREYVAARRKLT